MHRSIARVVSVATLLGCFTAACASPASGLDVEQQIDAIIERMTLEQKVGQMIQPEIQEATPADVREYHLGSVLNGGGSHPNGDKNSTVQDWLDLADAYYEASLDTSDGGAGIPVIWGTDAVHGHNNVMGATIFPHNVGLGAANDPDLVRRIGAATAREVAATGIDWTFAPTVAVARDNRWGRAYESFGQDPKLVAANAAQSVLGLQGTLEELRADDGKIIATAKHFIGDGGTYRGTDQGDVIMTLEKLIDVHGQGYIAAIEAGVQTVMATYNSWNGDKVHGNRELLTDVLKDRFGFDGILVSDWNAIQQVRGCAIDGCPAAINAGIDMIMVPKYWKETLENTLGHVRNGDIPMERIDDAVRRILRVKIRAGLFEKPAPSKRQVASKSYVGHPEHRAIAREAVRKSLVLLKNENALLPLSGDQHVLVTGGGANNIAQQSGGWTVTWQGTGTDNSDYPGATSIFDGIKSAVEAVGGSAELSIAGEFERRPEVAIVVFGEDPYAEFLGDRDSLEYRDGSKSDLKLIEALRAEGIPVVSVFLSGRPMFVTEEIEASDAFVAAWLPGSEGGGVADVLFRDAQGNVQFDFTGKLAFNWPAMPVNDDDEMLAVAHNLFEAGFGETYAESLTARKSE